LVGAMTGKSQEEINEMSQEEFEKVLEKINKIKSTPSKSSNTKN
jgi:hypothetical protein